MRVRHTELFLVRHGQTDSNVAGLFHGITDVPLNGIGERQADLVAARILQFEQLDTLRSSPLVRAYRTAQAISARTGLQPELEPQLVEMNFGEAEGLTFDVLRERYPDLMQRMLDPEDMEIGFPGGETRNQFHTRVRTTFDRIATEHQGRRIVVVAHGGVISSAIAQMLGENPLDWRRYQVANCSVTHVELATTGPITHLLNDVVHLEELHIDTSMGD